jgi:DMSO reductase anchor subunit
VPIAALGFAWVFGEWMPGQFIVGAILSVPCALITVWCTGMIYASLPTIRAWNQPLVAPVYVVLALATGGVLTNLLLAVFGYEQRWAAIGTVLALVSGAILKRRYWTAIDTAAKTYTADAATGLGRFGTVRPLDPPHTQPNFVMREMGYQVARRHAEQLRRLSAALLFLLPIVAGFLLLLTLPNSMRIAIALLSALSAIAGVLTERWLFFAEAEHVVMVFYRGGNA